LIVVVIVAVVAIVVAMYVVVVVGEKWEKPKPKVTCKRNEEPLFTRYGAPFKTYNKLVPWYC
jgi:hypothetical protein